MQIDEDNRGNLTCPKCSAAMEKVTFQTIEVDRCKGCGGIWFDALEQNHLAHLKGSEVIDTGSPEVGQKMNAVGKIDCPVCHEPMIRMVDPDQPRLWFESCTVCYGVYFDAGEFKDYKKRSVLEYLRDLLHKTPRD